MQPLLIERIVGRRAELAQSIRRLDNVELSAEQRERAHLRVTSQAGRELLISLPRGVELNEDDILELVDGVAIRVVASAEDLIEVRPRSAREWAMTANQLGNLHRPVRFLTETMLVPYDHLLEEVLRDMGVPFERSSRGFIGERVPAYTGSGPHAHAHGAGHGHDHHGGSQ